MRRPCAGSARERILAALGERPAPPGLRTWLRTIQLDVAPDGSVVATVPNAFVKQQIQKRYLPWLQDVVQRSLGRRAHVTLVLRERPAPETPQGPAPQPRPAPDADVSFLHPHYTFANFVVGPSNRLAHEACLHVLTAPGRAFNPLFIHGASGLGKTHLLQATCRAYLDQNPEFRVLYLSCEEFLNRFVAALDRDRLPQFRRELRQLDCLIVDDVHFLGRKKRMQEEFFHTFNALYDQQRQLILSSDSRPTDLTDFEERLVSRFQWGLLAPIEPPTEPMRRSILRRQAARHDLELPDEVAHYLARRVCHNVRQMEGLVTQLAAAAKLLGREIDLQLARETLGAEPLPTAVDGPDAILRAVAAAWQLHPEDLRSPNRSPRFALARHTAMFLMRQTGRASLREVALFFNRQNHTTVLHAIRRVKRLSERDPAFRHLLDRLSRETGVDPSL